jgi:hypothetical protein
MYVSILKLARKVDLLTDQSSRMASMASDHFALADLSASPRVLCSP